jgi:dienelactone hydrolase
MKTFLAHLLTVSFFLLSTAHAQTFSATRKQALLAVLGHMPATPPVTYKVLETAQLPEGKRYKIEYLSEYADSTFHTPEDRIRAYLFIPTHGRRTKLPAIVAIHQDGPNFHLGKLEPAGLAGDKDQHYGYELFKRGYVVICPDRFYHAERRRIPATDTTRIDPKRDFELLNHWSGQLLQKGRCTIGKEVYDLIVTTNILASLPEVDTSRIGAIGHSAGGFALVAFMFADKRIKAGVSSCGFFELNNFYSEKAPKRRPAAIAIPNLTSIGRSADFLAFVAPRSVLLTRGLWEWGQDAEGKPFSLQHAEETKEMVRYAQPNYLHYQAGDNLKAIYFDEDGGNHAFPPKVKEQAYQWLDAKLKAK